MKLLIFFAIAGLIFFVGFVVMHERVHVEIFRTYGIESEIDYFSDFPNAATYPEAECPSDECRLAHNMNEAISYVLMPLYALFYTALLLIIGMMERGGEDD